MLELIRKAIEDSDFEYYGIRIDDNEYQVGDITENSHVWVDGDWTDEELEGTCCVGLRFNADDADIEKAIEISEIYFGEHIYLIGGNSSTYGEDAGEYIISDAKVVAIIK